jgi:hypothetical protein
MNDGNYSILALNLILSIITLIIIPAGGFLIKKWIDGIQDAAVIRSEGLKEDIERLTGCMSYVKGSLSNKVAKEECKEKCDEKWERLNHHSHNEEGKVVVT